MFVLTGCDTEAGLATYSRQSFESKNRTPTPLLYKYEQVRKVRLDYEQQNNNVYTTANTTSHKNDFQNYHVYAAECAAMPKM